MEENSGPGASGFKGCLFTRHTPSSAFSTRPATPSRLRHFLPIVLPLLGLALPACGPAHQGDTLARIKSSGKLVYGSDKEGGGPYAFPDPDAPREVTGFEVDIMRALAAEVGATPVFAQGQWDRLL